MTSQADGLRPSHHIGITDVVVIFNKSIVPSKDLEVHLDGNPKDAILESDEGQMFRWAFRPMLDVGLQARFTVQPYRHDRRLGAFKKKVKDAMVTVPIAELSQRLSNSQETAEWRKSYPNFEMTIGLRRCENPTPQSHEEVSASLDTTNSSDMAPNDDELPPVTAEIFEKCPRFRILVIGKSGVGKSSLINRAFGTEDAKVAHNTRGISDINFEILSRNNPRFVLHDSQGFEHGEVENLNTVMHFIRQRNDMPELKDKLHAIWLCIETPWSGGRVLETGDEKFLQNCPQDVPVIVVFTKYDLLVSSKEIQIAKENPNAKLSQKKKHNTVEDLDTRCRKAADADFDEKCMPIAQKGVKVARISGESLALEITLLRDLRASPVNRNYEATLTGLVRLTFELVSNHGPEEAGIMTGIAQKPDIDLKIQLSIGIGRKRYWRGLASSTEFPGKTLKSCLHVVHRDIVAVWNFNDPQGHLACPQAQALMSKVVEDLADPEVMNPNRALTAGVPAMATVAGIVSSLSGPAAPIVAPIAAGVVFAAWVYFVYQNTRGTLRCLMGYIIGLTIIMQNLFWLMEGENREVSLQDFEKARDKYQARGTKLKIHEEIGLYVSGKHVFKLADRDQTLEKLTDLIDRHRTSPADINRPT